MNIFPPKKYPPLDCSRIAESDNLEKVVENILGEKTKSSLIKNIFVFFFAESTQLKELSRFRMVLAHPKKY